MNVAYAFHVVLSRQGWRDCQAFMRHIGRTFSDFLLSGPAVLLLLLDDEDAMALHDLAGQGVTISVTQVTLDAYELEAGHLPAYIHVVSDVETGVQQAVSDELLPFLWS